MFGLIAILAALAASEPPSRGSLLSNGDFEASRGKEWPDGWPRVEGLTWEVEDGNHFLRLHAGKPDKTLTVYRVVDVKPGHAAYELRFRVRHADLKRGKESWHDGRVILEFKDAKGQKLKGGPPHPNFKGTSGGWRERVVRFLVPEGAAKLEVMPALFLVAGGTLDLDDLVLAVIDDPAEIASLRSATAAATPVPVRGDRPVPPMLKVVGNQLQSPDGKRVWLQGVNVPSLEWSNAGENVVRSIAVATGEWRANAIRLPVRDDRWFGRDPAQRDGGTAYRKLVGDAVEAAATRGAYLVLDLHRYRAPTAEHAAFWKDAAARFKDHPAVLFDLFNEPHGISWEVWRDGGTVEEKPKPGSGQPATRVETIGMQALLDAVRETGARNVVVAGGLDWAYDLSGVVDGFALKDAAGNGVMYATHVYNWKKGWRRSFLDAAAKYPILVGECGCEEEKLSFIPANHQEAPATWAPDMLGLIQKEQLNWTAWSFHPKASPKLLANWDYQPTPYWGVPVKRALAGETFEFQRPR